jgi:chemotaxis signal transduction protein
MDVKESEQKISSGELLQLVSFHLGDEEYAADILNIQGINRMVEVNQSTQYTRICRRYNQSQR